MEILKDTSGWLYILVRALTRDRVAQACALGQAELEQDLGDTLEPVPWLPRFYALSQHTSLTASALYR